MGKSIFKKACMLPETTLSKVLPNLRHSRAVCLTTTTKEMAGPHVQLHCAFSRSRTRRSSGTSTSRSPITSALEPGKLIGKYAALVADVAVVIKSACSCGARMRIWLRAVPLGVELGAELVRLNTPIPHIPFLPPWSQPPRTHHIRANHIGEKNVHTAVCLFLYPS